MHSNVGPFTSQPILYCSFATLKGKERLPLDLYNFSADVQVGHCLAPSQSSLLSCYEEPGPSMNVASNKVTCPNLCLD